MERLLAKPQSASDLWFSLCCIDTHLSLFHVNPSSLGYFRTSNLLLNTYTLSAQLHTTAHHALSTPLRLSSYSHLPALTIPHSMV
jgi:hypothetical protein